MGANSGIEWTDHTFNPWQGCVEVRLPSGSACDHCYAREWRFGRAKWGANTPRPPASEAMWMEPRRWNEKARLECKPARVFCLSMGDIFEPRPDLDAPRYRIARLIRSTAWLTWLLLTKRPEFGARWFKDYLDEPLTTNVMPGVTIESAEALKVRAGAVSRMVQAWDSGKVFISLEPMLSAVEFDAAWLRDNVGWLILGGESGRRARPMNPDWARSVRDQCAAAGVPFFFKQWGESGSDLVRIGKKKAGRLLDGVEHNAMPEWFSRVPGGLFTEPERGL